jgi:hypothetical protein
MLLPGLFIQCLNAVIFKKCYQLIHFNNSNLEKDMTRMCNMC